MGQSINTQLFAFELKSRRGDRGLREIASEIGNISAATLSRIEQGKVPDVDTYIRLCQWMKLSADYFYDANKNDSFSESNEHIIIKHLRADRILDKPTIESLEQLIKIAFKASLKTDK